MPYDTASNFQSSFSFTLGAGPYNDLGFTTLQTYTKGITAKYVSGVTNRLMLTPASGGTTINSLDASGCSDGFVMIITNESSTDYVIFPHLAGGTASNQFYNANASTLSIPPLGMARANYVVNRWRLS